MSKKKPYASITVIFLIGVILIGLGVSNTAGQIQQELDSLVNSVIPPDSMALAASSSTSLSCAYGQTVTASVSGAADNPYGLAYAAVSWALDGNWVYTSENSDSSSYTTPSNLGAGTHNLVAYDHYSGGTITFTVIVGNPTLTISKSGSGSTSPATGSYTSYVPGSSVSITAFPSAGYQFSHWARGTTYVFTATDTFLMPSNDFSTTAVFVPVPATPTPTPISPTATPTPIPATPTPSPAPTPIPQVSLTMGVSGSGTISKGSFYMPGDIAPFFMAEVAPGSIFICNINSFVTISATPDTGNVFSYWLMNDGAKIYSAQTTLTMSSSKTALAVFTSTATPTPTPIPQYSLTIGVSGQGTTSPGIGTSPYNAGSSVSISASASTGNVFSYWLMNDGTKIYTASTSISMTGPKSALAVFTSTATPNPSASPTAAPTPLPTTTPSPTVAPSNDPTPIPTAPTDDITNPDVDDTDNQDLYIDANQLCTVLGGALIIIGALWLAIVQKWL